MALKASPQNQAMLLDLQAIDTRVSQLDYRARNVPELPQILQLESDSGELRSEIRALNGEIDDLTGELNRIESDVAVVEVRIARDADRLQASSSVKDVAGLEQELASLRRRQNDLEEIELTVMERLEEKQATLAELGSRLETLTRQGEVLIAARDATLAAIDEERSAAGERRHSIETAVQADLLALYEKQRSRYGTGASLLRGGVSQASGVKLLENELQAIRAADPDEVIMCASSEAILVRTEESGL